MTFTLQPLTFPQATTAVTAMEPATATTTAMVATEATMMDPTAIQATEGIMAVIATDMSMEKDMVPDMGRTNLAMVVTDLAMARMELDMLDTVMVLPMATLHMGTIITIKNCQIIRKMQFVYLYFFGV